MPHLLLCRLVRYLHIPVMLETDYYQLSLSKMVLYGWQNARLPPYLPLQHTLTRHAEALPIEAITIQIQYKKAGSCWKVWTSIKCMNQARGIAAIAVGSLIA